jgi:uncharacterized membrane protein
MLVDFNIINSTGFEDLSQFVFYVINFAISFSVVIVVISLVTSGLKYILSFGDDEKIKAATRSMAFSLLGLVLVFLSPTIIEFVIKEVLTVKK